jgi:PHD/YefM family antitoxin component YafN of YafNO toxin-antitoxin module
VTSLKTGASRLVRALNQNRRPVAITRSGHPRRVLLDFESYEELREAILLLKRLAKCEANNRAGRTRAQNEVILGRTRASGW